MFGKPLIYIQVYSGYLSARRIGGGSIRKECSGLSHPRTLMGDFMAVEASFRNVLGELRSGGLLTAKPDVLVHLVPEATGGYTNVEKRAFQEAALGAGARTSKVVTDRQALSDNQIAEALA